MQSSKLNAKTDFNPGEIEAKWQKKWESDKTFSPNLDSAKNPYYNLMMFPYPSAEGLHVGNMYAFVGADVYGRFQRQRGNDVLEPIGLDGFGIHSENYALKIGKNPKEQAKVSEARFYKQLRSIGNSFDWTRTLETYDPLYYRWTQWLFIKLFKAGLAYRKKAEVNWCPSCKTVLSDEQVIPASPNASQGGEGKCERCNSLVEKKDLEQWFFRITNYAERLLANIEKLDWTEKVKIAQRNWIGKKQGTLIKFKIKKREESIEVFTTRVDTLYGATFLVLAPEHPLAKDVGDKEVQEYIKTAKKKSNQERKDQEKEKTGVFSGINAINPINGEEIPIWIADYALMDYGTGALFGDAHDERDVQFANKYGIPLKPTLATGDKELDRRIMSLEEVFLGYGTLVNSGEFTGLESHEAITKITEWLESKGLGYAQDVYHLRDWLISRQRYWGPPIPMIYCLSCFENGKGEKSEMPGWHTVSEAELPVLLPDVEDWKPMGTGKSPLANHPEFYETKCPSCGSPATRETDVSDTFLDSAWYFLRYPSTDIESVPFDIERTKKWLPVNKYIGGAEHSVLHLLYARFVSMVLHDLKYTSFDEPFPSFFAHGLIIKDGAKMSKSKGNVVVPDEYINKYGADTLRSYLMFLGPYSDGGDFRDSGIEGMHKFLKRIWTLFQKSISNSKFLISSELSNEANFQMHKTIKKVAEDILNFKYNTAIASLMEWYNDISKRKSQISKLETEIFLKLLAPFAPFMTEELWQRMRAASQNQEEPKTQNNAEFSSIHLSEWPEYEPKYLESDELIIVIQVNGKKRSQFTVDSSRLKDEKKLEVEASELISKYLESANVKKVIHVPGRIINFVI